QPVAFSSSGTQESPVALLGCEFLSKFPNASFGLPHELFLLLGCAQASLGQSVRYFT
ncbi:unnamed protein product, partial [Bubo scandiacus]